MYVFLVWADHHIPSAQTRPHTWLTIAFISLYLGRDRIPLLATEFEHGRTSWASW